MVQPGDRKRPPGMSTVLTTGALWTRTLSLAALLLLWNLSVPAPLEQQLVGDLEFEVDRSERPTAVPMRRPPLCELSRVQCP